MSSRDDHSPHRLRRWASALTVVALWCLCLVPPAAAAPPVALRASGALLTGPLRDQRTWQEAACTDDAEALAHLDADIVNEPYEQSGTWVLRVFLDGPTADWMLVACGQHDPRGVVETAQCTSSDEHGAIWLMPESGGFEFEQYYAPTFLLDDLAIEAPPGWAARLSATTRDVQTGELADLLIGAVVGERYEGACRGHAIGHDSNYVIGAVAWTPQV